MSFLRFLIHCLFPQATINSMIKLFRIFFSRLYTQISDTILTYFFLITVLTLFASTVSAQITAYNEWGRPLIQNFSPEQYNAFPQNWSVSQFPDHRIIVGNVDGFLTFDGEEWNLLRSKNTVRVVYRATDGTVYAGLKSDFGYLTSNESGELVFQSMLGLTGKSSDEISDIWEIAEHENAIIFRHNEGFFAWDGKVMISQQAEKRFVNSFKVENRFFVLDESKGLYEYKNGSLVLLSGTKQLSTNKVAAILPHSMDSLFVITQKDGFYWLTAKGLSSRSFSLRNRLRDDKVFTAIQLQNRHTILGTINNGLYWFDENMNLIAQLNKKSGLIDDSILSFYEEKETGALWVTTNNGLARVSVHLPITQFNETDGLSGSLHAITRFNNQLYIATNQGISVFRAQDSFDKSFRSIRLPITQTWALDASKDRLIIAASEGLVLYRGGFLQFLDRMSSYCISPIPGKANQYLIGRKQGLFFLDLNNSSNPVLQQIPNTDEEIRSIAWESPNRVWLGLINNGTQRIELSDDYKRGISTRFDTTYGLPDSWLDVANLADEVVFLASDGIYTFNNAIQRFYKRETPVLKNNALRAGMIFNATTDEYWISDSEHDTYAFKRSGNDYFAISTEVDAIENMNMVARFKDDDGTIWIGHTNRLYRIKPQLLNRVPQPVAPLITSFSYSDSVSLFNGWNNPNLNGFTLPSECGTIRVTFAVPAFDSYSRMQYQVRMKGYEQNWSRLSPESFKEFTNLSKGNYTLEVRGETVFGQFTPVASLQFSVESGLFNSWYSYLVYLILLIGFSYGVSEYVKKQEQKKVEAELKKLQDVTDIEKSKLRAEATELRAKTAEYQAKLIEEESRRKTDELKQAREIQQHFLPKATPETAMLDIASVQKTATEVGGDYYDYLTAKPNDIMLVIGDVKGHGVGAGILVASTKATLVTMLQSGIYPTAEQMNNTLHELTLDKRLFMALLMARFKKSANKPGVTLYLTGGAIPPVYILRANGSVEEYQIAGLPLGASIKQRYDTYEIDLIPNDVVIMFTDGLPERQNSKGEALGYDRLHKLVKSFGNLYGKLEPRKKARASNVAELMISIGEKWAEGSALLDDITVLVAKVKA